MVKFFLVTTSIACVALYLMYAAAIEDRDAWRNYSSELESCYEQLAPGYAAALKHLEAFDNLADSAEGEDYYYLRETVEIIGNTHFYDDVDSLCYDLY